MLYNTGYSYHLEQLAATHGLYLLSRADSEEYGLGVDFGISFGTSELRPGLVAVQGALASALERNWTNLALFLTRTPPLGEGVDVFGPEVEKYAEENEWAGDAPTYLVTGRK